MVLMVESQVLELQWKQIMSKQRWTAEIKHPFLKNKVTLWGRLGLFWLRLLRVTHLTSIAQITAKALRILICVVHLCCGSHYKYPRLSRGHLLEGVLRSSPPDVLFLTKQPRSPQEVRQSYTLVLCYFWMVPSLAGPHVLSQKIRNVSVKRATQAQMIRPVVTSTYC